MYQQFQSAMTAAALAISLLATTPSLAEDTFPISLQNCGATVTLEAVPKRIFVINSDDFALLDTIDSIDLAVARTTEPPPGVFGDEALNKINAIPTIATEKNATGGSVISLEKIIESRVDLVLGPESAVDRALLNEAGIALYSPPAFCSDKALIPGGTADFERVYDQVKNFGLMFGKSALAAERIEQLKKDVAAVATDYPGDHGTAMALYVAAGGKTLYPYGARSMVTPVFAVAGLKNVYAETDQRVFEASTEELLGKNPDTIILLYSDTTPDKVLADFASAPGVDGLDAVRNNRVVPLLFQFTDPPTPLSVKGVKALAEKLAALK